MFTIHLEEVVYFLGTIINEDGKEIIFLVGNIKIKFTANAFQHRKEAIHIISRKPVYRKGCDLTEGFYLIVI